MSVEKKEFYGKEVTDAIKLACDTLNVPQEMLDIEVIETGSTGIFGLIRKKARIRVAVKQEGQPREEVTVEAVAVPAPVVEEVRSEVVSKVTAEVEMQDEDTVESEQEDGSDGSDGSDDDDADYSADQTEEETDASPESIEIVANEVSTLVELMHFPSEVKVNATGLSIFCSISGEFEEQLAGPEGKTLDSIQYLVRKMVARKCTERLRITINVGDFRERRLEELKERAVDLAGKVKETGKTHVLPALNPSERREIHMILQEDKEVRSRSVGDGLFKKILIYKPGKGNRGGRRKSSPRGRKGKNNKSDTSTSSSEE
jgi:spoIIIJ-associated protein